MNLKERYKSSGKKRKFKFFVFYLLLATFLIFYSTYSRYTTIEEGQPKAYIANWKVKINNEDITNKQTLSNMITLVPDTSRETTTDNKLAPGKTGFFDIIIDPTGTEVAIEYTINFDITNLPTGIILTNIDNDHLDYFKNLDNIKKSFKKYINLLPSNGLLIKNNDDENSNDITINFDKKIITYGIKNISDYMAKNLSKSNLGHYSFDIFYKNEFVCKISLNISGIHNVYNALAAFALSYQYIKDVNTIKTALEKYRGVGRRFEYLGTCNGAYVYDDYAHHPTEIKTTLDSVKNVNHNKDWAIFQSHTFSRTKEHLNEFANVLSNFDNVIIAPIYPAREINTFNINEDMLVNKIKEKNPNVVFIDSFDKIVEYIKKNVSPDDLIITIGAGPVNKISNELVKS